MRLFLPGVGFLFLGLLPAVLAAETAQEIVEHSAGVYAGLRSWTLEMTARNLDLTLAPGPTDKTPNFTVRASRSQQIAMKLCLLRNEWMVMVREGADQAGASKTEDRTLPSGYYVLVRAGGQTKQTVFGPQGVALAALEKDQGMKLLRARISKVWDDDIMLGQFVDDRAGFAPLRLLSPVIDGQEPGAYRIAAKLADGTPILAWIEKGTYFVVRTVVVRQAKSAGVDTPLASIREARYVHALDPGLSSKDFNLSLPSRLEPFDAERMDFAKTADLIQLGGLRYSAASELSDDQTNAVVTIGGGAQTFTGFMARMQGADFVVTTQRALAGDKKLTVTTARGEELPVLGIFGAVGGDIALLRIPKIQGDLKIASGVTAPGQGVRRLGLLKPASGQKDQPKFTPTTLGAVSTRTFEMNVNPEPGSMGAPVFDFSSYEVIGVTSRSDACKVTLTPGGGGAAPTISLNGPDTRWFGTRIDGVERWEAINLARFRTQREQLARARALSEVLMAFVAFDLGKAAGNDRVAKMLADHQSRVALLKGNPAEITRTGKDLVYNVRSYAESDLAAIERGDFYDYFRTGLNWEDSVPGQVEYRKAIIDVLKKYESNPAVYLPQLGG